MEEKQYVIPGETPGVTQFEFTDWRTAEAAQRALLEIDRSVASAELLVGQMARKRREIGRSMADLTDGIAYAAKKYEGLAQDLSRMVSS